MKVVGTGCVIFLEKAVALIKVNSLITRNHDRHMSYLFAVMNDHLAGAVTVPYTARIDLLDQGRLKIVAEFGLC